MSEVLIGCHWPWVFLKFTADAEIRFVIVPSALSYAEISAVERVASNLLVFASNPVITWPEGPLATVFVLAEYPDKAPAPFPGFDPAPCPARVAALEAASLRPDALPAALPGKTMCAASSAHDVRSDQSMCAGAESS